MNKNYSGLQKNVLQLYRELLRTSNKKDPSKKLAFIVSSTFRENAKSVGPTEWSRIEYMIRAGYKQKKIIEMPGFTHANLVH